MYIHRYVTAYALELSHIIISFAKKSKVTVIVESFTKGLINCLKAIIAL